MTFIINALSVKKAIRYALLGMAATFLAVLFLGNSIGTNAIVITTVFEVVVIISLSNAINIKSKYKMEWTVNDEGLQFVYLNEPDGSERKVKVQWNEIDHYEDKWQRYNSRFEIFLKNGDKIRFYLHGPQHEYKEFLTAIASKYYHYCT